MERHAGGSQSIPTVHQRRQRREVVGSPATDKAVKHDRSTTGARSTAKLSHHFFLILNWFFICFRCHALSSRSLGFGLHSPNLFVSHLAVLSRWYKKAISHWSWVFLRLGAPLARLNLKKAFDQSEVARQQVDQSLRLDVGLPWPSCSSRRVHDFGQVVCHAVVMVQTGNSIR